MGNVRGEAPCINVSLTAGCTLGFTSGLQQSAVLNERPDKFSKFPHKGSARLAAGSARALAQSAQLRGGIAIAEVSSFSRPYLFAPGGRIRPHSPSRPISAASGNLLQEHWGLDAILTEGWGTPSSYAQRPLSAQGFLPSDASFYPSSALQV
jgi:hypothetical protein